MHDYFLLEFAKGVRAYKGRLGERFRGERLLYGIEWVTSRWCGTICVQECHTMSLFAV